jgi:hypothetical protein
MSILKYLVGAIFAIAFLAGAEEAVAFTGAAFRTLGITGGALVHEAPNLMGGYNDTANLPDTAPAPEGVNPGTVPDATVPQTAG